jgi:hypothetical protein
MSEAEQDMENTLDETIEKLMKSLIVKDENVVMHTEIQNPLVRTALKTYAKRLKDLKLDEDSELMNAIVDELDLSMISHNRLRASEIVEMVKSVMERRKQNISIGERLIGEQERH